MSKKDRTARLLKVEHLLYQNPRGLTIKELARSCQVSERTTRRDLNSLELELGVLIYEDGNRWCVLENQYLPPIKFTLPEALSIFLAARLMLSYAHRYDPNVASTFVKLNSILPTPLREEVQHTLDWMLELPRNERYLRVLAILAESWIKRRRVNIIYRALEAKQPTKRTIEPYFIEPAAVGHASYVIAYCHRTGEIRNFKIDRIENIQVTEETYDIPPDFDAIKYFGSAWGVVVEGETRTIRLRFDPAIARIIEEAVWHPSQVLGKQKDGSVVMTLQIMDTVDLYSWILSWGEKVEVLEPAGLREEVIGTAEAMLELYKKKQRK